MRSNLLHFNQVIEHGDATPPPASAPHARRQGDVDDVSRERNVATVFMVLLVGWDLAGGAFEATRRPLPVEVTIFAFGLVILCLIPLMRSRLHWVPMAAFIACAFHFVFAATALVTAPETDGFGPAGPGIAALFLGFAALYSLRAHRDGVQPMRALTVHETTMRSLQ